MIPLPGSSIYYFLGKRQKLSTVLKRQVYPHFLKLYVILPISLGKTKTSPEHLIHPNPSFCCYLFIDKPTFFLLRHFWGGGQFIEIGLLHISVLKYMCSFWICLMVTAAITHQFLMIHSPKFNAPIIMSSPNDCSFKPNCFLMKSSCSFLKLDPLVVKSCKICQWIPHLNCLNHAKIAKKNIPSGYD